MDYIVEIIALIIGAIFAGAATWGVSMLKSKWDLSDEVTDTLERWIGKMVDYIIDKAEEAGADLEVPETRWYYVNQAIDAFVGYLPKLMDAVGYSKKDLAEEVERFVRKTLKKKVSDKEKD